MITVMFVAHASERRQKHHPRLLPRNRTRWRATDGRVKVTSFSSVFRFFYILFFRFVYLLLFSCRTLYGRNLETTIILDLTPEKNKVCLNGCPSVSMEVENRPGATCRWCFFPFSIDPWKRNTRLDKEREKGRKTKRARPRYGEKRKLKNIDQLAGRREKMSKAIHNFTFISRFLWVISGGTLDLLRLPLMCRRRRWRRIFGEVGKLFQRGAEKRINLVNWLKWGYVFFS